MDEIDLFADFDQETSGLLDEAMERIEYLRDQLIFWRAIKRKLEEGIPDDPVEELLAVAGDAWQT